MPYKLIAADIDGTLLDSRGELTETTAQSIRQATAQGVTFVLATGRPIQGVQGFCRRLGLRGPVITYNGAMVVDAGTHEILFRQCLRREDAETIWALGRSYGTDVYAWADDHLYGARLDGRIQEYKTISGVEPELVTDFGALAASGISKILWHDETERIGRFFRELDPAQFPETTFCPSRPWFLEFFHRRASKATALEQIGHLLGIRRDEMIAIGDGFNDLSMIRYAGLGVAMANAPDDVKRQALHVAPSNDADGVAAVIRRFCL